MDNPSTHKDQSAQNTTIEFSQDELSEVQKGETKFVLNKANNSEDDFDLALADFLTEKEEESCAFGGCLACVFYEPPGPPDSGPP